MIPKVLKEIVDFLSKNLSKNPLPIGGVDGRSDSAKGEEKVIGMIQNENSKNGNKWGNIHSPNISSSNNRSWYDIKIDGHYCDIKISNLSGADNTNAKHGIYYFLTGQNPDKISNAQSKFFKAMKENEKADDERDYFYIVINKNNHKDIFITSLKNIPEVNINPNNLPFQAKWNDCRKAKKRTWEEAKQFLLDSWAMGIKKKIALARGGMPESYPEYFKN